MIQPVLEVEVLSLKSEAQMYKDRTNNTMKGYNRHILNCILGDEVAGVSVMCEGEMPKKVFNRGDKCILKLTSFAVESCNPVIKVKENDIELLKK
jgi:hypothetical protein